MNLNEFISERGQTMSIDAGAHLFRQGDPAASLYVIKSGLFKAYYLSTEGKENIKSFILPGDNIGSLSAGFAGEPCTFGVVSLEPSEVVALEINELYAACREHLEIAKATVDFLLAFAMKKERREYELLCLSAEERYRALLEKTPAIFEAVTQNDIARYLGVTPVGLSRIKKRVAELNVE